MSSLLEAPSLGQRGGRDVGDGPLAKKNTFAAFADSRPGLAKNGTRVVSVALVLAAWQLVGVHLPFATSYPTAVAQAFGQVFVRTVLPSLGTTLEVFAVGFGICLVVGVPLGLGMARINFLRVLLEPYNTVVYSTPFVIFYPLLILAFGLNFWLRVGCVIITALFPIVINTFMGAEQVDGNFIDVGTSFVASKWQILRTIILPGSLPYLFVGLRLGFARGMIGVVVIEMEASSVGIGHLLSVYSKQIRMAPYFVIILVLGLYGIVCTGIFRGVERWTTMPWARRPSSSKSSILTWTRMPVPAAGVASAAPDGYGAEATPVLDGIEPPDLGPNADEPTLGPNPLRVQAQPLAWTRTRPVRRERKVSKWDRWPQSRAGEWAVRVGSLVVLIAAWQLYSQHINSAVLPSPSSIAHAFYDLTFVTGAVWAPVGSSALVLIISFAIALVLGIPIGILMGRSRLAEHVIDPYVAFLYALPHVTLLPLMIVWLGFGAQVRVGYAVFSAIFAVVLNTMAGTKNVDQEMVDVGQAFCASKRKVLRSIIVPGIMPYVIVGARQAFAMAWGGVVIAEIISIEAGIGGLITYYNNYFRTPDMVVPILYIMAISLIILKGTDFMQRRLTPWASKRSM
jgi:ABC-type nitrate/sulfonate/bicarbonate transport system permease component